MQLFDFNKPLIDLDGSAISEIQRDAEGKPSGKIELVIADVAISVLMALTQKEEGIDGKKKMDRYFLAQKIKSSQKEGSKVKLDTDEISLIKKLIGEKSTPLIVGQVWEFLENGGEKELTEV